MFFHLYITQVCCFATTLAKITMLKFSSLSAIHFARVDHNKKIIFLLYSRHLGMNVLVLSNVGGQWYYLQYLV